MLVFVALFIIHACIAGTIPATPENITVTFLTPTSVRVSWQTMLDLQRNPIEKYVVTYKPTDDRVVQQVAGNSEAVVLDRLQPNTQYQITVSAVWAGKKYRSRQVIFRTLDWPKNSLQQDQGAYFGAGAMAPHGSGSVGILTDDVPLTMNSNSTHPPTRELPPIRGVEVGIVLIVLLVWAGAIALFFNRWGKIRMLLPYQPDYKQEQLKVPGTGVCTGSVCNGQHSHQCEGSEMGSIAPIATLPTQTVTHQHFHYLQDEPSTTISERCTRSRINSAIFVSSEGHGFDSIEFLRRHGSQSVLCRKARSAENISDEDRKHRFSENRQWSTMDSSNNPPSETIELAECHTIPSTSGMTISAAVTPSPLKNATLPASSSVAAHTATVTTSNTVIVGSISIETPPSHIQQQQQQMKKQKEKQQQFAKISTTQTSLTRSQSPVASRSNSPIFINNQNNNKIIAPSTVAGATSTTAVVIPIQQTPIIKNSTSSLTSTPVPTPVHVSSSLPPSVPLNSSSTTVTPATGTTGTTGTTQASKLRPPKLTNLPTLSISGPSPPHDEEFL